MIAGWRWSRTHRTWSPRRWRPGWPARPDGALALAGQGLRDVTRIAAGDTALWTQILLANAAGVSEVLALVADDLRQAAAALADAEAPGAAPGDPAAPGAAPPAGAAPARPRR